jgi:hypothetical protein
MNCTKAVPRIGFLGLFFHFCLLNIKQKWRVKKVAILSAFLARWMTVFERKNDAD